MNSSYIIGHDKIKKYISGLLKENKLSHGYLFSGPNGIGKRLLSLEVSKIVFCKNSKIEACGSCSSCHKFDSLNHPDIIMIEPDGNSIKNKQVEDIQSFIKIKPNESEKKIIIIDNADKMTISAQNRILKTLEEPPSYGMIFLISSKPHALLPTIKSRCQIIDFGKIEDEIIEKYLETKENLTSENAKLTSKFADGSLRVAIDIVHSEKFKLRREQVVKLSDVLIKKELIKIYDLLNEIGDQSEDIIEILDLLNIWFRDLMFLKSFNSVDMIFNLDFEKELKEQSRILNLNNALTYIEMIENTKKKIASNVNCTLAFESCVLNIQEV